MMTVQEFCDLHNACTEGREWALATGAPDMAALWARDDVKPEWRVWIATREGVLDDKTLRLFAVWCAREALKLVKNPDPLSVAACDVAERHAHGLATDAELAAACAAACAAARDAAWAAAWAAARDAAWAAAWAAARAAVQDAVQDAQAQYLINNTTPNFERSK